MIHFPNRAHMCRELFALLQRVTAKLESKVLTASRIGNHDTAVACAAKALAVRDLSCNANSVKREEIVPLDANIIVVERRFKCRFP